MAYGDTVTSLTDNVPVAGLSGAVGSEVYYKIDVPAGQGVLHVSISGGTGDCDLYVKQGSLPTYIFYDYRPFQVGNNETVTASNPAAGTWYIMLRGHDVYSGVTLLAHYEAAVPTGLTNGVPVTGISAGDDTERLYSIDVPAGQSILEVTTSDGTGNVDLYVKYGSAPSRFDFDSRASSPDTGEQVSVNNPTAGRWYIMLHASGGYHDVTLRAVYSSSGTPTSLQDGVPLTGLSGTLGSEACYVLDVPDDVSGINFSLAGGTGNCDMYIMKGARPTTSNWDYRSAGPGNSESMFVSASDMTGPWYILLVATQAYSGATLKVDLTHVEKPTPKVKQLTQGVAVTGLAGKAGDEQFFSIDVPNGVTTFQIKMSGGTGDADLYVRKGDLPTVSQYDNRPYLSGNDETVTITQATAGTWYIMIRGYQAFSGITLLVTFGAPTPTGVVALANGVPVTGLFGSTASETFYKIDVPADQTKLEIKISGGTGDADLYVRVGDKPTTHDWDYRPFVLGNNETVTIDQPKAGTYYIMIRGYMAYTGVTLTATYGPESEQVKTLDNCVPLAGLAGDQDSEMLFKIDVPADQNSLHIEISGGTGDADLYVKKGDKPTTKSWDYHPGLHGNNEAVDIQNPAATTWYIMIQGYQAYAGVTLQACYKPGSKNNGDCGCTVYFP
jgi:hypothetical protein